MSKPKGQKGKTKSGFEYEIPAHHLDNYELLELFAEVDENPLVVPKLITLLLGTEQKDRLIEHLRTEDGNVPIESVTNELTEIMKESDEVKN